MAEKQKSAKILQSKRQKLLKRLLLWSPVILLLLGIGGIKGYREFKSWRAREMAARALQSFEQANYRAAFLEIRSARHLRFNDPKVLRASAIIDEGFGQASALEYWERLAKTGQLSADDLEARTRAAARFGTDQQFQKAAAALDAAGRKEMAARMRVARDVLRGNQDRAIEEISRLAEATNNPELKLDVIRLLVRRHMDRLMALPEQQSQAIVDKVSEIITTLYDTPQEPPALAIGLVFLNGSPSKRQEWADRALKTLKSDNPALLPAATAVVEAGRSSAADIYRKLRPLFDSAPLDRRAAFATWLTAHKLPKEALTLITAQESSESKEAFIARVDALAAMGNWGAVVEVASAGGKAPESIRLAAKSRAEFSLGRQQSADKSAADAVRAAAGEGDLPQVISLMDQLGVGAVVDNALVELCGDPRLADAAFRAARERFTWREPRGGALLAAAYDKALVVAPRSPSLQDFDRFNALVGALTESAASAKRGQVPIPTPEETSAAMEAAPADPVMRITHALALLQAGKAPEAARVFDDFTIYFNRLPPSPRAAMAAIMNAGGQPGIGAAMVQAVDTSLLSPQEQKLLHLPPTH